MQSHLTPKSYMLYSSKDLDTPKHLCVLDLLIVAVAYLLCRQRATHILRIPPEATTILSTAAHTQQAFPPEITFSATHRMSYDC